MGEKKVRFRREGSGAVNSIMFQVTGVGKPLASVSRILDKGNSVVFSRSGQGSYIVNEKTRERIQSLNAYHSLQYSFATGGKVPGAGGLLLEEDREDHLVRAEQVRVAVHPR